MKFFTTGVYNSTERQFFDRILDARIDLFCDVRQRRGVRGAKYAFVNSERLQAALAELGVNYCHVKELAPTSEIRSLQKEADLEGGVAKRERQELGEVFKAEYENRILADFDLESFVDQLDNWDGRRVLLFCVEEHPAACHRSLIAGALQDKGYEIEHI